MARHDEAQPPKGDITGAKEVGEWVQFDGGVAGRPASIQVHKSDLERMGRDEARKFVERSLHQGVKE